MKTLWILVLFLLNVSILSAQNKDTATVSISGYRLHEGTFSWRNTNTYFDRTPWESAPYTEGHLRHYNGAYRQNFRLLYPNNYDPNYEKGYPLMVVFHGAGERGNCWDKGTHLECYYGDLTYRPDNAPVGATQEQIDNLLNNDHSLAQGGGPHLNAVLRSGTLHADDPGLNLRGFPGFVYYPQSLNGWTTTEVIDAIRTVRLLAKKHNINPDRIYMSGLSNGGRGALNALVEADWLFAAAATFSAITNHDAFRNQVDSLVNIPIWMFQGGQDTYPVPAATKQTISIFQAAGGIARYTEYPTIGHGTWNTAWAEPDYFRWFLNKKKSDIHVYYGSANVCETNEAGAKLSLPQGFPAYQWEHDGAIIPGATSHLYTAVEPGIYRARFSRVSANPSAGEWNEWSSPVSVGEQNPVKPQLNQVGSVILKDLNGKNSVTLQGPEGKNFYYWYKDGVLTSLPNTRTVTIQPGDCTGNCANNGMYTLVTAGLDNCPSAPSNGKGVFFNDQAPLTIPIPTNFTATLQSSSEVVLRWNDVSGLETGYEIWRRKSTDNSSIGWTFVTITNQDAIIYTDKGLQANTTYWYKIRAVSNTARSNYAPGNSKVVPEQNVIISTGTDSTPPTAPQNLVATLADTDIATQTNSIQLSWDAATDESGLKEYQIRFGTSTIIVPANQTSYLLQSLPLNNEYNFSVYAVDHSDNLSAASNPALANTYIDGFFWEHSTGAFTNIGDVPTATWENPEFKGRSGNLTLEPAMQEDFLVFRFYGYVYISTPGEYLFRMRSNDGVQLYLDGTLVARRNSTVENGLCATTNFTTGIPAANLTAGAHTLEIRYFQHVGDKCLSIQWAGPDAGPIADRFYDIPDTRISSHSGYTPPVAPEIPQELIATSNGMTQVDLSWTYPGTPLPEFEIQRALSEAGPFTSIGRVSTTGYSNENLLPGTTYYYRLRSIDVNGISEYTPVVDATTENDTEAPTPPTSLTLVSKTVSTASIGWTASTDNTGVIGYEIWANGILQETTSVNYHLLDNLEPFTEYAVYVVAFDANNNKSVPSNVINFDTTEPLTYFSKPTGDLNNLATWGVNNDGSGDSPSSFSINGIYLYVANRSESSIGGTWEVEGNASRVIVSPGVTLTVESALNAILEVSENSTLILSNFNVPELGALSPLSTVVYSQNATFVKNATYGNLVLNGTGSKTFQTGITTVLGDLTINNNLSVKSVAGNVSRVAVAGDVTFIGTRGTTLPNERLSLQLNGSVPQSLNASNSLDLFEIVIGSIVDLVTGDNQINLNLGANSGGGLSISTGSTFNIHNNNLVLSGAATINNAGQTGSLAVNNATIDLASSSNTNSNLYFSSTENSLSLLTINLTGTGTAEVQSQVNINDGLKIRAGDLNSNGFVTLISTEEKTANLQEIENGGRVLGDVVVQRYISPKEKTYRYISSPVSGIKVSDWQNYFAITGNFTGSSKGPGLSSAASFFYYQEPNWIAYPTTSNEAPIEKGKGYSVYIRHDGDILMDNIGNPYQGNVIFDLTPPIQGMEDSGWNLLGNPYASTIAWSTNPAAWIATEISSVVAVRNNMNASSGQFLYYDASTGLGTGTGGLLTGGRISQGQAFYIQSIGSNPALTITEKAKSTGQQAFFRKVEETPSHLKLFVRKGNMADEAIIALTNFGTDDFDSQYDGLKKKNEGIFNFSTLSANDYALAINNMNDGFCSKTVRLNLENTPSGTYTLSASGISSLSGVGDIVLRDHYTAQSVNLMDNPEYAFRVTSDPASFGRSRFELVLNRPDLNFTLEAVAASACSEDAQITIANTLKSVSYTLENKSGEILMVEEGNGGGLSFRVPKEKLSEGLNDFTIKASYKGCGIAQLSSDVLIEFYNAPAAIAENVSVCKGTKANLRASANISNAEFSWYSAEGKQIKGATDMSFETETIDQETYFYVAARLSGGCEGPQQIITVTPVELQDPDIYLEGDSLISDTVADSYMWTLNGLSAGTTITPFYPVSQNGTYAVTLTKGGCSKSSKALNVFGFERELSGVTLYPNPTTANNINVIGNVGQKGDRINIKVVDASGREIFKKEIEVSQVNESIKIAPPVNMRPGVYFLIIDEDSKATEIRFVITE